MKDDKSKHWFVRITAPWEHIERKFADVTRWLDFKSAVIGYHIGTRTGKPHAHIAIALRTELQKQSVDIRFKRTFDVKGANYSSVVWDQSTRCIAYLHHDEKGKVEYINMYTPEERNEIQLLAKVTTEVVAEAKKRSSTRIVERILDEIRGQGEKDIEWVCRRIYKGVQDLEWYPPGYRMNNYVEEILIRQSSDSTWIDRLTRYFMNKFIPRT